MTASILIILACILLVASILVQNSKGGGFQSQFETVNLIAGPRKGARFIERTTMGLAIFLFVLSIFMA